MAWTTPKTFVALDPLSAAEMNTHLRDNISFLAGPPRCRVYNSANISVPNAANTALTFNSERFDTDTMHSTATNTSRITFTTAGTYLVGGSVFYAANATGVREISIRLNGGAALVTTKVPATAAEGVALTISALWAFSAGDYVTLNAYHTAGVALNALANGNDSPEFWAILMAVA